jgi:hypothetical protein
MRIEAIHASKTKSRKQFAYGILLSKQLRFLVPKSLNYTFSFSVPELFRPPGIRQMSCDGL